MTQPNMTIRMATTAIAAALAFSSTPLLAQDTPAPETSSETPVTPPDPLAPEPVTEPAAEPPATEPSASEAAAAPARTTARRSASASRPAPSRQAATAAGPAPPAAAPAPTEAPPAAEAAPVEPAPPVPVEPAASRQTQQNVIVPILAATAAALLLALAGLVLALRRRKRRRREREELNWQIAQANAEEVAAIEPEPVFARAPAPEPIQADAPATAPEPAVGHANAPATKLPEGFDVSRFGRHVQAAYRGPTPDNPSLSLKYRLRRAGAMDQRERLAGSAAAEARHAEAPAARPAEPAHGAGDFMLARPEDRTGARPAYSKAT